MRPEKNRFYTWSLRTQWQPGTFGPGSRCSDASRRSFFNETEINLRFHHPVWETSPARELCFSRPNQPHGESAMSNNESPRISIFTPAVSGISTVSVR